MSDDDKEDTVVQESLTPEILPPVLREIPNTRHHVKNEQLGLQIRDLARLGLSKSSTALIDAFAREVLPRGVPRGSG